MNIFKCMVTCPVFLVLSWIRVQGQEGNRIQRSNNWREDTAVHSIVEQHLHEDQASQAGGKQQSGTTRWGIQHIDEAPGTQFWPAQSTALGLASQTKAGMQPTSPTTTWLPAREPFEPNVESDRDVGLQRTSRSTGNDFGKVHWGVLHGRELSADASRESVKSQPSHGAIAPDNPSIAPDAFSNPFRNSEFSSTCVFSCLSFSSIDAQTSKKRSSLSSGNPAMKTARKSLSAFPTTDTSRRNEGEN
jgi:hypothetical protein